MNSENRLSYLDSYDEIKKHKNSKSKVKQDNIKSKDVYLPRSVRWFLFVVFVILGLLMNIDHGTFPAATDEIRQDLEINDEKMGVFGSLVFFGNTLGKNIF
jgi:hypothetical protein